MTLEEVVKKIEGTPANSWEYSRLTGRDPNPLRGCVQHNDSYTTVLGKIKIKVSKHHGTRWFTCDWDGDSSRDFESHSICLYVNDEITKEYDDSKIIKPIYNKIEKAIQETKKENKRRAK